MYRHRSRATNSFTLLELLIVIGILGILGVTLVLVLNPAELFNQARDSTRVTEIQSINKAIAYYLALGGQNLGDSGKVYVSVPDTSPTCANLSLPGLPSGWTYECKDESTFRNINGTGWIPVDFTSVNPGSPFVSLPVDPENSAERSLYYAYVHGNVVESWVLASLLQSDKYLAEYSVTDGGTDPGRYEQGSDLALWTNVYGLVGHWNFDENNGTLAQDDSGNNLNGTLFNPTWSSGKVNSALDFNGAGDYVELPNNPLLEITDRITLAAWVKADTVSNYQQIISKANNTSISNRSYYLRFEDTGGGPHGVFAIDQSDDEFQIFSTNNVALGSWVHIAGTFDGSNQNLYINGQQAASTITLPPGIDLEDSNTYIGTIFPGDEYFDGNIDEVRIFNRALSEGEINAMYTAEK